VLVNEVVGEVCFLKSQKRVCGKGAGPRKSKQKVRRENLCNSGNKRQKFAGP
jgi:hypothetical protein